VRLVIVDDLDVSRAKIAPGETHTKVEIDADRVLSVSVTGQLMKSKTRNSGESRHIANRS